METKKDLKKKISGLELILKLNESTIDRLNDDLQTHKEKILSQSQMMDSLEVELCGAQTIIHELEKEAQYGRVRLETYERVIRMLIISG